MKRKKSRLWSVFEPKTPTHAECTICNKTMSYKSSITNLRKHLTRQHPTVNAPQSRLTKNDDHKYASTDQPEVPETKKIDSEDSPEIKKRSLKQSAPIVPKKVKVVQKEDIDEALLKLITQDLHPFSLVEGSGFQELVKSLNSSYSLPDRKSLSNKLLPAKYEDVLMKTINLLQEANSVTLTADCWTSYNNDCYMSLTAHFIDNEFQLKSALLDVCLYDEGHTSINVAAEVKRVADEWSLTDKVLLFISDNISNIKNAVTKDLQWTHANCIAHTIDHIATNALQHIEPLLDKISYIVSYFKRNTQAKNLLDYFQIEKGLVPKKLIRASNGWNSIYYMLERVLELKEELTTSLISIDKEDLSTLTDDEFIAIDQLVRVLAPLESATKTMSNDKKVLLSLVIIITNGLDEVYEKLYADLDDEICAEVREVVLEIISGIKTYFNDLEANSVLLISTILDPRFKTVGFSNENVADKAKEELIDCVTAIIEKKTTVQQAETEIKTAPETNRTSIWSSFDKKVSSVKKSLASTAQIKAKAEIQRYLQDSLLERSEDPLYWWMNAAYVYPHLSETVRLKFGQVATSVPCKWIFSKTGKLLLDRRNRLSTAKVKEIMFVHVNSTLENNTL